MPMIDSLEPERSIERRCLSAPPHQLKDAVRYLDAAVSAHLTGQSELAAELFRLADMPSIRAWGRSIWANSRIHLKFPAALPILGPEFRAKPRMPSQATKNSLHKRDGYHCRFCDMPVVRAETRKRMSVAYPKCVGWGAKEVEQHAALLVMWAQYDHIIPHARGGTNDLDNLVVSCGTCNFGRAGYLLEEVDLLDPRERPPVSSYWDGLERFR